MRFSFFNKSSCCGGGKTKLQSTGYAIDAANPSASMIQALDRFYANYRIQPTELILSEEELTILQRGLSGSEFSLVNGQLFVYKLPIVLATPIV